MPDETDGEELVDSWGIVDDDGDVEVGRFAQTILVGAITTVTYGIADGWIAFRDRLLEYYAVVESLTVELVDTYFGIPVEVLEAASAQTTSWFHLYGVAAYPIATVIVFSSITIVYWGVRWYV